VLHLTADSSHRSSGGLIVPAATGALGPTLPPRPAAADPRLGWPPAKAAVPDGCLPTGRRSCASLRARSAVSAASSYSSSNSPIPHASRWGVNACDARRVTRAAGLAVAGRHLAALTRRMPHNGGAAAVLEKVARDGEVEHLCGRWQWWGGWRRVMAGAARAGDRLMAGYRHGFLGFDSISTSPRQ